jgi:hypothetical protein
MRRARALSRASTALLPWKQKDVDGRDKPGHDEPGDFRQHIVSDCGAFAMIGARAEKIFADYQP